jgi:hypothetical protein
LNKVNPKDLIEMLQHVIEAQELLEKIWLEIGPYREGELTDATHTRLNNFMRFDDSE